MEKYVICPCCKRADKPLDIEVPDGFDVDFDMRHYTHKTFCDNCRRVIKYSFKQKQNN